MNSQKTWYAATDYCRSKCMNIVSVNDESVARFLGGAAKQDDVYGFWTGGVVGIRGWIWAGTGDSVVDPRLFSKGGRQRVPQPDNFLGIASGGKESETCLSVLNDWYGDGATGLHDFRCLDELPFVCELA